LISGALFPVAHLQAWLTFLNRIDPLTYAVDPMKNVVFSNVNVPPARRALDRASSGSAGASHPG
jgi:ABC-2 type transport system permease protein